MTEKDTKMKMTISVSRAVKKRMNNTKGVKSWSAIAEEAFREKLKTLEAEEEELRKSTVLETLAFADFTKNEELKNLVGLGYVGIDACSELRLKLITDKVQGVLPQKGKNTLFLKCELVGNVEKSLITYEPRAKTLEIAEVLTLWLSDNAEGLTCKTPLEVSLRLNRTGSSECDSIIFHDCFSHKGQSSLVVTTSKAKIPSS